MYTFKLHGNYPNPFNPTTSISYEIPENGVDVRLSVYNVLGQHVVTLVNEQQNAGRYHVNFDAASLASGVYIYRLTAGQHATTSQMTLVK
jgi:hypothetical protein